MSLRVLVTGGRDFTDRWAVFDALDRVHRARGVSCIIHGGARGADSLAGEWARLRGVSLVVYPADWQRHKNAAGPIRNRQMLADGEPEAVVAFPGGAGTAHMAAIARAAGLPLWEPLATTSQEQP